MSIHCFALFAETADGLIARTADTTASTAWTSKEDKKFFIQKTKDAGVIVMGLTTYKTIGKPLPGRLNVVYAPAGTPEIPGVELTSLPPKELLADLERRGHTAVAICGGATIYTMFMEAGAIDTLYITVEPLIFGSGLRPFNKDLEIKLSLREVHRLGNDVLVLEYSVKK